MQWTATAGHYRILQCLWLQCRSQCPSSTDHFKSRVLTALRQHSPCTTVPACVCLGPKLDTGYRISLPRRRSPCRVALPSSWHQINPYQVLAAVHGCKTAKLNWTELCRDACSHPCYRCSGQLGIWHTVQLPTSRCPREVLGGRRSPMSTVLGINMIQ